MRLSYTMYTDPGHGWLAVPLAELAALGIDDKISSYSYQRGDTVYLEEDCDAPMFIRAKNAAGGTLKIKERNCAHRQSRIRNYAVYKKGQAS